MKSEQRAERRAKPTARPIAGAAPNPEHLETSATVVTEQPDAPQVEPLLATIARVGVYGLVAAVFTWPLADVFPVVCAALLTGAGAMMGPLLARTSLRSVAIVLFAAIAFILVQFAGSALRDSMMVASSLGPANTILFDDVVSLGLSAFVIALAVRALSARRPLFAALEVLAISSAFAQLVIAHRHGAINRPFDLADPIISAGGDPSVVFFGLGAICTATVILFLVRERNVLRYVWHLAAVALLLGLLLGGSGLLQVPPTPLDDGGLGLNGEGEEGDDEREGEREREAEGGGESQPDNELRFQNNFSPSQRQTPVGVVLFHDDYSPPSGAYYLRQDAFSHYNGRRMVRATEREIDRDTQTRFPTTPYEVDGPALGQNRTLLETTVALMTEHGRPVGLEAPIRYAPTANPNPDRFVRTYRVTSAVMTADFAAMIGAASGDPSWSDEVRAHYLKGPDDPRYAALAEEILAEFLSAEQRSDAMMRVAAVTQWLGRESIYNTQTRHANVEDPVGDFLFGDREGYCVHLAHAAVYLMREAGLPARVATGYAIDEATRRGGSALLITSDRSHAWPEVYLDGFGWVVTDVTPARVATPPPSAPDPDLQRLLGELARGQSTAPPDANPPIPAMVRRVRGWIGQLGWALLFILMLGVVTLYVIKTWRALRPRFANEEAAPRVVYRSALDRLSEVGVTRTPGESQEAFAARVGDRFPSLRALTGAHVGSRYGSLRVDRAGLPTAARALREELKQDAPLWRRVVGLVTPWSFLRSR